MCGIAGITSRSGAALGREAGLRKARAMSGTLVHRGPDDQGAWISPRGTVALSHRRLSIIDLSPLGRNPMLRDEGRLAITFNGEIYNYLELRRELEQAGHHFQSSTDTEVILAAYDAWGLDCVHRLAGMFAFALWDERRQRLWIARDRLGKKPLYYAAQPDILLFASELKALLASDTVSQEVDADALRLYLRYGYIPAPFTIFKTVRKLEPAHSLVCEDGRLTVARYWDPLVFAQSRMEIADAEAEAELEARLSTAVKQRLIADVPLGAFLSGGIDSSLVVALMQEHSANPVRTFTIRFENQEYNEADAAAAVARHLGTEHHEQLCDERRMLAVVDRLPDMFDEPFGDSSAIPTYLVSETARQQVTVALSGDGGDELFFGYPRYRYHADALGLLALPPAIRGLMSGAASRLPTRRLRRIADVLRSNDPDTYARFIAWTDPAEIERISGAPAGIAPLYRQALAGAEEVPRPLRPGLLDLVSYLPDDILTKVDRTSMAVSLEVRAPLLDHRVVELALALPLRLKRRGGITKWLLRQMLTKRVPRHLIDRPKMGFGVPLRDWFMGPLRDQMNEYCQSSALEDLGLDPEPIRGVWREFHAGKYHRPDLLWQAFALMAWSRNFVSGRLPA